MPCAFPAIDTVGRTGGALIEWFYQDGVERFVQAGDLFQSIDPTYDRQHGSQHAFDTVEQIRTLLSNAYTVDGDWHIRWSEMLLLDALTGNGDRHQDNWGVVVRDAPDPQVRIIKLAPAFDNGSSLGREFPDETLQQFDGSRLRKYIDRGRHQIKWTSTDERGQPHLELLIRLATLSPRIAARLRLASLTSIEPIIAKIHELSEIDIPHPLTQVRAAFIERLLRARFQRISAQFI